MKKTVIFLIIGFFLSLGFFIYWSFPKFSNFSGTTSKDCKRGGCGGEICVNKGGEENFFTTCERFPEDDCYHRANCALQADGECGFEQSLRLKACLFLVKLLEKQSAETGS